MVGWAGFALGGLLASRLVYEQTVLTWQEGPQTVGFTMIHAFPELLILGLLGDLCILVWLLGFLVIAARRGIKKRPQATWSAWMQFVLLAVVLGAQPVSYGAWQRVTFQLAGPGPKAVDQMVSAAAVGDRATVEALLRKGIPISAREGSGLTALDGACNGHQLEIARYLISRGAQLQESSDCMMLPEFNHLPQVPGDTVSVDGSAPSSAR